MSMRTIYTIFVFIALAAFEHVIIGLFPPLFQYIAQDLNIEIAQLGFVSAINIMVTAISSIIWGYLADQFNRKRLIIVGTIIWVLSIFLTALSKNYAQLFGFQIITGIGLGCMASVGFSVLTDYIPYQKRGFVLSLWGMAQGFGGIVGSILASVTSTHSSWRWPFELVGIIGVFLIVLYLFVEEPNRGKSEPELKSQNQTKLSYNYRIQAKHIKPLLLKGSNVYLFIQAFFLNISTGSLIWIPTLFIYKMIHQGYSMETAVMTSGYLYALFQLGGMTSSYFGYLGDKLQRKSLKGRAYITAVFVALTLPLYLIFFSLPMTNLSLPTNQDEISIFFGVIQQVFMNPWILFIFITSFLASAAQSANTPNWLALITDVNLPEHRGTAFSVANLFNSLGRTTGNVGVGLLLGYISTDYSSPYNYIITLSILQIFLLPSALCYVKMAKRNVFDIKQVKNTLSERRKRI